MKIQIFVDEKQVIKFAWPKLTCSIKGFAYSHNAYRAKNMRYTQCLIKNKEYEEQELLMIVGVRKTQDRNKASYN